MAIQIEDGTGSGKLLKINGQNRLQSLSVTKLAEEDMNERTGKDWSIPFEGLNPTGADDYVLYIKNTGDAVLAVTDLLFSADTATTQIEIHAVSGTASGGTDVTPVSRTVESASLPTATIQSGADITGLTNEGVLFFMQLAVADTQYELKTQSKIRIPKGKAIAVLVETATANITGVISMFEED